MDEIIGLFPTPFMRVPGALDAPLVAALAAHFTERADRDNPSSRGISHSAVLQPGESPLFVEAARRITPKVEAFGALLFGEQLAWSIKEMWVNVLQTGGHQARHNHANSFVSGVVYLTPTHPSAQTVFMKAPGGNAFVFSNANPRAAVGAFNTDKWIAPPAEAGDMVLFPSYLLHEVPPNAGGQRISLAFNAIPSRLDSWGYAVSFAG